MKKSVEWVVSWSGAGKEVAIYEDVSLGFVSRRIMAKAKFPEARGLLLPNDRLIWWDANLALHQDMSIHTSTDYDNNVRFRFVTSDMYDGWHTLTLFMDGILKDDPRMVRLYERLHALGWYRSRARGITPAIPLDSPDEVLEENYIQAWAPPSLFEDFVLDAPENLPKRSGPRTLSGDLLADEAAETGSSRQHEAATAAVA